ncbi:MAG: hypothetical protein AB1664_06530 [Thermodesulfobacteriota bacterium]
MGKSRGRTAIPRGIEVLVKKASVDPAFREVLLNERAAAAGKIGLELSVTEAAMLNSVPRAQIEHIIENTTVPDEHRRVFLSRIGAAMLAVLTFPISARGWEFRMEGIRPDTERSKQGIRPEYPQRPAIGFTAVRVLPLFERLRVEVADIRDNAITVKVDYNCPFDSGELIVILGVDTIVQKARVTCQPSLTIVRKGKGEEVFSVEAKGGATEWILVRLLNATEEPRKVLPDPLSLTNNISRTLRGIQPGEYIVCDLAIYRITRFRKVWPS